MKSSQIIIPFSFLAVFTIPGCEDPQTMCNRCSSEGKAAGYMEGRIQGIKEGNAEGFVKGHKVGNEEGYKTGLKEGRAIGFDEGCIQGFDEGQEAGKKEGIKEGEVVGKKIGYVAGQKVLFQDSWLPTLAGGGLFALFIIGLGIPFIFLKRRVLLLWQNFGYFLRKREIRSEINECGTYKLDASSFSLPALEKIWKNINDAATADLNATIHQACASAASNCDRIYLDYHEELKIMRNRLLEIDLEIRNAKNSDRADKVKDVFHAIEKDKRLGNQEKLDLMEQLKSKI